MARTAITYVASTVAQHIFVTGLQDNVWEGVNQDGRELCVIKVSKQNVERFDDALYLLTTYFALTKSMAIMK